MFDGWFRRNRRENEAYRQQFADRARDKRDATADLTAQARAYHAASPAGKMATTPTKPMATPHDLSLAYSPGVAEPCRDIAKDPSAARRLTTKAHTVAVVSNGTAVLGLGDIGALAAKPVMEGKAALFKKFGGLDAVDLCIDERDPAKLAAIIAALEPSYGGVNLEDIKAPDCFTVEQECRKRMNIPVFHDDQHGTAVCVLAALENALALVGKTLSDAKIVTAGAGAAAIACLELLVSAGAQKKNICVTDRDGVVYRGRKANMDPRKATFAQKTRARRLDQVVEGADVFLGLSVGGVLSPDMVRSMADAPIIFALANPDPEIWPEDVRAVAPDAIVATGRSDYPNQVNNVLCFPFLFRGALEVGAKCITEPMKVAAAGAIATLAKAPVPGDIEAIYPGETLAFGRHYILPKPFDPRLLPEVAIAVARAAVSSGVAAAPPADWTAFHERLANEDRR